MILLSAAEQLLFLSRLSIAAMLAFAIGGFIFSLKDKKDMHTYFWGVALVVIVICLFLSFYW